MNIRRHLVSSVLPLLLLCCFTGQPADEAVAAKEPVAEKVNTGRALPEKVTFTEHIAPIVLSLIHM